MKSRTSPTIRDEATSPPRFRMPRLFAGDRPTTRSRRVKPPLVEVLEGRGLMSGLIPLTPSPGLNRVVIDRPGQYEFRGSVRSMTGLTNWFNVEVDLPVVGCQVRVSLDPGSDPTAQGLIYVTPGLGGAMTSLLGFSAAGASHPVVIDRTPGFERLLFPVGVTSTASFPASPRDVPFGVRIDVQAIVIPADIAITSVMADNEPFDPKELQVTYNVSGTVLGDPQVAVYWAHGTNASDVIGKPIYTTSIVTTPVKNALLYVPGYAFKNPPRGATNVLVVADPAHVVNDLNLANNTASMVRVLRHDVFLANYDAMKFTYLDGKGIEHPDGKITASMKASLDRLLTAMEGDPSLDLIHNIPADAYMLATVKAETGIYQPIAEGSGSWGLHTAKGDYAELLATPDGQHQARYYGRGFVQLTWQANYAAFSKLLGLNGTTNDLANNPDAALDPTIAYNVMSQGMRLGLFRKDAKGNPYKLGNFINASGVDYVGARNVVNGQDKAGWIAAQATKFEALLNLSLFP